MYRIKTLVPSLFALVLLASTRASLLGQEVGGLPSSGIGAQSLRPYWHVFIAYAIAILLVLGWVISIGRRLRDVEERLSE